MAENTAFQPAWWLPGAHCQTLWPTLARVRPRVATRRERLELADGDFLDIDWTLNKGGPIVVILHGLEGSVQSPYAAGMMRAIHAHGWRAALMHFRGCSGEPNRLARSYHSGETGDIDTVISELRQREPSTPLGIVGYSLGGNVLLKWLGEQGKNVPVAVAAAVSVPFDLKRAALRLNQGFSRLYQWSLIRRMRRSIVNKFRHMSAPVAFGDLSLLTTFHQFDDAVTAPLHGFAGVDDYYARCSSRPFLRYIHVPTLILHAQDDPFMVPECIPTAKELSRRIHLEVTPGGGHVGFVGGRFPWTATYFPESRIPQFMAEFLS